jgi:hypothetical protein
MTTTVPKLKTCRDCKKQDLYDNFPQKLSRHGKYTAVSRCADCYAKARVKYRKEHRDHIASYEKRWFAQHPGYKKTWRQDAPYSERLSKFYQNAHDRNLPVELTEKEIADLFNSECFYCGDRPEGLNGIDRCDPRFGYLRNNVVAACTVCNFNKQSLSKDEFFAWVARIANRHGLIKEG